jgi:hypothetical protein
MIHDISKKKLGGGAEDHSFQPFLDITIIRMKFSQI